MHDIVVFQHIYSNVEHGESPHGAGGFQTFGAPAHLSACEVEEIESRLPWQRNQEQPSCPKMYFAFYRPEGRCLHASAQSKRQTRYSAVDFTLPTHLWRKTPQAGLLAAVAQSGHTLPFLTLWRRHSTPAFRQVAIYRKQGSQYMTFMVTKPDQERRWRPRGMCRLHVSRWAPTGWPMNESVSLLWARPIKYESQLPLPASGYLMRCEPAVPLMNFALVATQRRITCGASVCLRHRIVRGSSLYRLAISRCPLLHPWVNGRPTALGRIPARKRRRAPPPATLNAAYDVATWLDGERVAPWEDGPLERDTFATVLEANPIAWQSKLDRALQRHLPPSLANRVKFRLKAAYDACELMMLTMEPGLGSFLSDALYADYVAELFRRPGLDELGELHEYATRTKQPRFAALSGCWRQHSRDAGDAIEQCGPAEFLDLASTALRQPLLFSLAPPHRAACLDAGKTRLCGSCTLSIAATPPPTIQIQLFDCGKAFSRSFSNLLTSRHIPANSITPGILVERLFRLATRLKATRVCFSTSIGRSSFSVIDMGSGESTPILAATEKWCRAIQTVCPLETH